MTNLLLDKIMRDFRCANDSAICRLIDTDPGRLSRVRHRKEAISDGLIARIARGTGWSVAQIDELIRQDQDYHAHHLPMRSAA